MSQCELIPCPRLWSSYTTDAPPPLWRSPSFSRSVTMLYCGMFVILWITDRNRLATTILWG